MKKIFMFLGVIILILSMSSCASYELTSEEKEKINNAFEKYIEKQDITTPLSFELKKCYGKYNEGYVVLYKSNHISPTYRKDTINNVEIKYAPNEQMFVYFEEKIYSLKDAYLNILIQTKELTLISSKYMFYNVQAECEEIGQEIVLEEKILYSEENHIEPSYFYIGFYADNNFLHSSIELEDIKINLKIKELIWGTSALYKEHSKNGFFPPNFRHIYIIKLEEPIEYKETMIEVIRELEKFDFVYEVRLDVWVLG